MTADLPEDVRKHQERMSEIETLDADDVFGPYPDVKHEDSIEFDDRTMGFVGSDRLTHTRTARNKRHDNGVKVSTKVAEWEDDSHFEEFLNEYDLEMCGRFDAKASSSNGEVERESHENFIWCNEDITVVTTCNPITGEGEPGRCGELGYASSFNATGEMSTLSWMETQFRRQRSESPRYKDLYYYEDGEIISSEGGQM